MPRKRAEKPSWFKLFGMHRPLMEVMPAEALGEAMKAVMTYFATGELTELTDPYAIALFAAVKPQVDDAYEDLRRSIECGRAGGLKAKEMYAAGTGGVYPPTAPVTEGEGEREEEGEGEGETDAETSEKFRSRTLRRLKKLINCIYYKKNGGSPWNSTAVWAAWP